MITSNILNLPPKKLSTFIAVGYFNICEICLAASYSGFTIRSIPSDSRKNSFVFEYSGFLILAIVYFAPICLAAIQQIMLISSLAVTEINISASAESALVRTS